MDVSLIAQRSIYSALNGIKLETFEVSKKLIQYAKNATAKLREHLQEKKWMERVKSMKENGWLQNYLRCNLREKWLKKLEKKSCLLLKKM